MSAPDWVVFDVDDVMLDMDGLAGEGIAAVARFMGARHGEARGARIARAVAEGYAMLRGQLRAAEDETTSGHERIYPKVEGWQRGVVEAGHEVKIWSREVLVAIALEREGLPVTAADVEAGAAAYWEALGAATTLLDDARRAVRRARAQGAVVHLATNSDGGLVFDEAARTFRYDPFRAERTKRRRLEPILQEGLTAKDLTVGDPVGKPHAGFYTKVLADIEAKTGRSVDPRRLLPIGDSLTNDVLPFMALGAPRGIWLLRGGPDGAQAPAAVDVVASLDEAELGG